MSGYVKADGYRGIWFTLGQYLGDEHEYGDKYSGGLGTYTAKHVPLAAYAEQVKRTFFVYGGCVPGTRHLLAMASYYDHRRGVVPRPTIVHDKAGVDDPHDDPSIALDEHGHVWIFVSGRGRHRPGFKYRSAKPYDVDAFELVSEEEMTYPQPWWIEGRGFLYLFTKYTGVRELYWNRSPDGRDWTEHRKLAGRLITACGEPRKVAFLESGPGGPPILEEEPGTGLPTGLEALIIWPIGCILMHFAVVGILYCFAGFPIFGRPQKLPADSVADFGKHIDALGELLQRTGDPGYASERLAHYQQTVRGETAPISIQPSAISELAWGLGFGWGELVVVGGLVRSRRRLARGGWGQSCFNAHVAVTLEPWEGEAPGEL